MRFIPEINHKSQNLEAGTFNEVEQIKPVAPSLSKNIQIPIPSKLTQKLFFKILASLETKKGCQSNTRRLLLGCKLPKNLIN